MGKVRINRLALLIEHVRDVAQLIPGLRLDQLIHLAHDQLIPRESFVGLTSDRLLGWSQAFVPCKGARLPEEDEIKLLLARQRLHHIDVPKIGHPNLFVRIGGMSARKPPVTECAPQTLPHSFKELSRVGLEQVVELSALSAAGDE